MSAEDKAKDWEYHGRGVWVLPLRDRGAHCAGVTGSVPPLWAVKAGCLIIDTYLHGYHGPDMNENDVADIITRCYLAAQNGGGQP